MLKSISLALVLAAACTTSSGPSPMEACDNIASATCARIYACFTAEEIQAAAYPATEAACVTQLQAQQGCAAETDANACDGGNQTYHASEVDPCLKQLDGLTCGELRQVSDISANSPACSKICAIDD